RRAAETLRDAGLRTVLHAGGGAFKAQLKRADASGARYAVIVGDDEAAAGTVAVKALRAEHAQLQVTVAEAAALIKKG
ncbi:MAG: His/Gly/Thr/Pro-type tRNA ligase C-terminal domain-containing protein, partial [Burkholderiales bacterium]